MKERFTNTRIQQANKEIVLVLRWTMRWYSQVLLFVFLKISLSPKCCGLYFFSVFDRKKCLLKKGVYKGSRSYIKTHRYAECSHVICDFPFEYALNFITMVCYLSAISNIFFMKTAIKSNWIRQPLTIVNCIVRYL